MFCMRLQHGSCSSLSSALQGDLLIPEVQNAYIIAVWPILVSARWSIQRTLLLVIVIALLGICTDFNAVLNMLGYGWVFAYGQSLFRRLDRSRHKFTGKVVLFLRLVAQVLQKLIWLDHAVVLFEDYRPFVQLVLAWNFHAQRLFDFIACLILQLGWVLISCCVTWSESGRVSRLLWDISYS